MATQIILILGTISASIVYYLARGELNAKTREKTYMGVEIMLSFVGATWAFAISAIITMI